MTIRSKIHLSNEAWSINVLTFSYTLGMNFDILIMYINSVSIILRKEKEKGITFLTSEELQNLKRMSTFFG